LFSFLSLRWAKASAWYVVTYAETYRKEQGIRARELLGFPWIMVDLLAKIKKEKEKEKEKENEKEKEKEKENDSSARKQVCVVYVREYLEKQIGHRFYRFRAKISLFDFEFWHGSS
jgi:hypothetical protein